MTPELIPLPITEKQHALLLNVSLSKTIAYRQGFRLLPEPDLKKLDGLQQYWDQQFQKDTAYEPAALSLYMNDITGLIDTINLRLSGLRCKLYKDHRQLRVLEEQREWLPLKCRLLYAITKATAPDIFNKVGVAKFKHIVSSDVLHYGPYAKLELEYRIRLLEAEQAVQLAMLQQLNALLAELRQLPGNM